MLLDDLHSQCIDEFSYRREKNVKYKKHLSLMTIRGGDPGRILQSSWKIAHLNKQKRAHIKE